MTPLQELLVNRMSELDLSFRGAAARSGGLVSHGTLNNIALGRHSGNYDDETLRGIALAIDMPLTRGRPGGTGRRRRSSGCRRRRPG
jgi:hypothetical protein